MNIIKVKSERTAGNTRMLGMSVLPETWECVLADTMPDGFHKKLLSDILVKRKTKEAMEVEYGVDADDLHRLQKRAEADFKDRLIRSNSVYEDLVLRDKCARREEVSEDFADFETETLTITDVNRPGLQFVGFFDYFDPRRLQIIGKAETMFLKSFSSAERRKCFEDLFKYEIPALVISRKLDVFPECMEMAQKYGRTLLRTEHTSVEFTSMTIDFLNHELAPMITRHGVLMDVYGEGVLILGDSGIGKSETAIELIKRGHRLVADDAVEIRRIGDTLTGTAPELIRHYLEVRGIGVVDIQKLFGMSGVKSATQIDLVIQFERWQDEKFYDRLGLDEAHTQIMGVPIPLLTIPVSAGRNLAGIVELAVMNNRQKKYGINSAREFVEQIDSHIDHQAAQEKNR